ncbi:MAG: hypothetical protein ABI869_05550 [Actinomycetota bacterium]
MAIKGKGKTRGRQPARAPRRAPVDVKTPLFLRRGVQVSLALIAGFLLMMLLVWVTNGLRKQRADKKATTEASEQRAAAEKWKSTVEGSLGTLGTLAPGTDPVLLSQIGSVITALQKGGSLKGAAAALQAAQDQAKAAADPLAAYGLGDQVGGTGMSLGQVDWFLNSQKRIVQALELYRQAAATAALAVDATGEQRKVIADRAIDLKASADALLKDGWSDYQNALGSVSIVQTPALTGLTGATGPGAPTG